MSKYNKAIAAVVGAVAAVAICFNIDVSEEAQAALIAIGAGFVTLLGPKNAE